MKHPVICLDPGHGGSDRGADRYGIDEADLNLELALETAASLRGLPIEVALTRSMDTRVTLEERGRWAARLEADFVLVCHVNANGRSRTLHGLEMYHRPADIMGAAVSRIIMDRVPSELVGGKTFIADNKPGITHDNWLQRPQNVLEPHTSRGTPAALAECGYLSNADDNAFITTRLGRAATVCSLRAGVIHAARMISAVA